MSEPNDGDAIAKPRELLALFAAYYDDPDDPDRLVPNPAKAAAQARPADPRVRFDNGPKPVPQPAPQAGSKPAAPSKENLALRL